MTLKEKQSRAYIVTIIGAVSFGVWQSSFFAIIFAACILLFLGGLVVAVQDGLKGVINSLTELTYLNGDTNEQVTDTKAESGSSQL